MKLPLKPIFNFLTKKENRLWIKLAYEFLSEGIKTWREKRRERKARKEALKNTFKKH